MVRRPDEASVGRLRAACLDRMRMLPNSRIIHNDDVTG